jgi:hypothetical protein
MDEVQVSRVFTPDDLARLFRRVLPSLPQPRLPLSPGIRKKVAPAIRRHPNPDWWEEYFATVQQRPFLMGSNDRGWQATLTWLCLPRAEDGIAEGRHQTGTRGDAVMNNALRAAQELQVEDHATLGLNQFRGLHQMNMNDEFVIRAAIFGRLADAFGFSNSTETIKESVRLTSDISMEDLKRCASNIVQENKRPACITGAIREAYDTLRKRRFREASSPDSKSLRVDLRSGQNCR